MDNNSTPRGIKQDFAQAAELFQESVDAAERARIRSDRTQTATKR